MSGPAGAGKTVLARGLFGLLPQARYRVHYITWNGTPSCPRCFGPRIVALCQAPSTWGALGRATQQAVLTVLPSSQRKLSALGSKRISRLTPRPLFALKSQPNPTANPITATPKAHSGWACAQGRWPARVRSLAEPRRFVPGAARAGRAGSRRRRCGRRCGWPR